MNLYIIFARKTEKDVIFGGIKKIIIRIQKHREHFTDFLFVSVCVEEIE